MDARSPVWWGNLLLICIETTSMVLLIASYFYIRRNFWEWPPPLANYNPPIYDPSPDWIPGTLNVLILAASTYLMYLTDMAARRHDTPRTRLLLLGMVLIAAATSAIRFWEFHGVHFRWDDNAYASITWTLLGTHFIYLAGTGLEFLIALAWLVKHELDEKHALDITLMGGYWYWAVAIWVPTYVILYWYPRWS
jgi:heme/copper-type cytochrome/quinol oxidase subunit 3